MKKLFIYFVAVLLFIPSMATSQERRRHRHHHHRPPAAVEVTPEELALIQLLRSTSAVIRIERLAISDGNVNQDGFGYQGGELTFGYADPTYYPGVTPAAYDIFIVFDGIDIPPGTVITRAWLEYTEQLQCQQADIDIYASLSPEPKSIDEFNAMQLSTPYRWIAQGWSWLSGDPTKTALPRNETVDFAPTLQEVFDNPAWVSGGTVVLVLKGVLPGCVFGMVSTLTTYVPVGWIETYRPKLIIEIQQ